MHSHNICNALVIPLLCPYPFKFKYGSFWFISIKFYSINFDKFASLRFSIIILININSTIVLSIQSFHFITNTTIYYMVPHAHRHTHSRVNNIFLFHKINNQTVNYHFIARRSFVVVILHKNVDFYLFEKNSEEGKGSPRNYSISIWKFLWNLWAASRIIHLHTWHTENSA